MADIKLAEFLRDPVMLVVASRGRDGRAAIGRAMGVRPVPEGLDVLVSAVQWPRLVDSWTEGARMALTLCRPSTYETYQMKGRIEAPRAAGADDLTFARAYYAGMSDLLRDLGVGERQIAAWFSEEELVRARFLTDDVFTQTPGPGAGRRIEMGPA